MPTLAQRPRGRLLSVLLCAVCAWAVTAVPARAQDDFGGAAQAISFQRLWQTVRTEDYTVVQIRRFFDGQTMTAVREELRVASNGTNTPDFDIDYLGVIGEPAGSPLWTKWRQNYAKHGNMFVEHGTFEIRSLPKVWRNYTLHDFGATVRAGRSARRLVVFPNRIDKAIWLLEVDAATLVPLYTAEYDASLRLLSEIEVVSFANGAQLIGPANSASLVSVLPTFADAQTSMGSPGGLVDVAGITGEYSLDTVKVKVDPLNNRQTLILEYTDGVDQLFVTQTPGVSDFFAGLPVSTAKQRSPTIARYRDPAMSVLLFWDDGVVFQVAGRGSLVRLDSFAKKIYTKALLGT